MSTHSKKFELPRRVDGCLKILFQLYAQDGKELLQKIVVNAQIRIHEEWTYDNWNGGTYGHALYLAIPEALFLLAVKEKDSIQSVIREDLNKVHNVQNESFDEVFLESEEIEDSEWRKQSGLLLTSERVVEPEAVKRIWNGGGCRVFLSHKAECKVEIAQLKEALGKYRLSCFVAHEDIHPAKAWQDEIENALFSMDALIALMSDKFHDSNWTDQEVGVAMGRNIPIVSVRIGSDPYGFIGKYQAVSGDLSDPRTTASKIYGVLLSQTALKKPLRDSTITALVASTSYEESMRHVNLLSTLDSLSDTELDFILSGFEKNDQLHGCGAIRKTLPFQLNRLTGKTFVREGTSLLKD